MARAGEPDGTRERPFPWPYSDVAVGHVVTVTTGLATVESIDNEGMTVVPEKGQRQWLRRNR